MSEFETKPLYKLLTTPRRFMLGLVYHQHFPPDYGTCYVFDTNRKHSCHILRINAESQSSINACTTSRSQLAYIAIKDSIGKCRCRIHAFSVSGRADGKLQFKEGQIPRFMGS